MPAKPTTLFVPFKGGLDAYSNPHVLPRGTLTATQGAMLDRAGAAYPGPGYVNTTWDSTGGQKNHGFAAVAEGPNTNNDQLLTWTTRPDGKGPGVAPVGSGSTSVPLQPLAPWRQATQRFQEHNSSATSGGLRATMTGTPQVAIVGSRAFYVWLTTGGGGVAMVWQDLNTRQWSGPYNLQGTTWTATPSATPSVSGAQLAVLGDSAYLRVTVRNGSTATTWTWLGSSPLTASLATVTNSADNIDSISTGDEVARFGGSGTGAFLFYVASVGQVSAQLYSGASVSPSAVYTVLTGLSTITSPITGAPVRATNAASSTYMAVGFNGSGGPVVGLFNAFGTISPQKTITGITVTDTPKQVTIANTTSGSSANLALAVEYTPASQSAGGLTYTWNYVAFNQFAYATPGTVTATNIQGWGGLALLGKMYSWNTPAEFRPLVVCRSGWYHSNGAFGTATSAGVQFAYPNGYLYDYTGQLYGKFGDADVGTDSLWPAFSDANYVPAQLQPLSAGFTVTLATGAQTLTYPWPQVGFFRFISARTADAGSPIGALAGLSTVTWTAPTAAEPPCSSVQFGTSQVFPGTLTAYYDGSNIFEAGFLHCCPTPFVVSAGGFGNLPTATTYTFQAVMVYRDASGRVHYSAPSRAVAATTTVNNDSFNFAIPFCAQTLRSQATPIGFLMYRNAPSSAVPARMYLLPVTEAVNGGPAVLTRPLTANQNDGGVTDTLLIANSRIYTDSQQAFASAGTAAPPPFDCITVWNNQVWGLANRNGPELWCTWPQDFSVFDPEGPAWSPANRIGLPAEIGVPKAIAGLDDKLLVFGTRSDVGFVGNAPARSSSIADQPSLFTSPAALPSPGGIQVLNGVTRLPGGILLQGSQGFVLLNRQLQYEPVGIGVKAFTNGANASYYLPGVLLPEQNSVLLYEPSGPFALLYNYVTSEWSRPEPPPSSATSAQLPAVRATFNGQPSVYILPQAGNTYAQVTPCSEYMTFTTPWINLASNAIGAPPSIANEAILREVHVIGSDIGGYVPHTLTLLTEFDYASNTVQPPVTQTLNISTEAQDYQWLFGFPQGNCRRVRFTVTINGAQQTSNPSGLPLVLLSGLMLSYDVDDRLSRLGAGNSTGT